MACSGYPVPCGVGWWIFIFVWKSFPTPSLPSPSVAVYSNCMRGSIVILYRNPCGMMGRSFSEPRSYCIRVTCESRRIWTRCCLNFFLSSLLYLFGFTFFCIPFRCSLTPPRATEWQLVPTIDASIDNYGNLSHYGTTTYPNSWRRHRTFWESLALRNHDLLRKLLGTCRATGWLTPTIDANIEHYENLSCHGTTTYPNNRRQYRPFWQALALRNDDLLWHSLRMSNPCDFLLRRNDTLLQN